METLVQLLDVLAWPLAVVGIGFMLRKSIKMILERFSNADSLQASIGPLTIQANALRDIHQSIQTGFRDPVLRKVEVEALIDTKIRSIQAALEHEITKSDVRTTHRFAARQSIHIITEQGDRFDGETIDVSEIGIGFKSNAWIGFGQIVSIRPAAQGTSDWPKDKVRIVRIEQAEQGYYYGAALRDYEEPQVDDADLEALIRVPANPA